MDAKDVILMSGPQVCVLQCIVWTWLDLVVSAVQVFRIGIGIKMKSPPADQTRTSWGGLFRKKPSHSIKQTKANYLNKTCLCLCCDFTWDGHKGHVKHCMGILCFDDV